jgi:hypothetical protein
MDVIIKALANSQHIIEIKKRVLQELLRKCDGNKEGNALLQLATEWISVCTNLQSFY